MSVGYCLHVLFFGRDLDFGPQQHVPTQYQCVLEMSSILWPLIRMEFGLWAKVNKKSQVPKRNWQEIPTYFIFVSKCSFVQLETILEAYHREIYPLLSSLVWKIELIPSLFWCRTRPSNGGISPSNSSIFVLTSGTFLSIYLKGSVPCTLAWIQKCDVQEKSFLIGLYTKKYIRVSPFFYTNPKLLF